MKPRLEKMTWEEIGQSINSDTVCIVPNGSTEQHGPHLKIDTDTNNAYKVALKAASKLNNTLVSPPIPFGCSDNHMNFPGTISLKLNTLKAVIKDVVQSLVHHGIRKIILMVGHGGNITATNCAAEELRSEINDVVIGVVYLAALVQDGYKCLESDIVWHSDEWETSFTLFLNPDGVEMEKAVNEIPHSPSELHVFHEDELTKSPVNWGLPMTDVCTNSGVFGYAKLATAEKGKIIAEEMINNLVKVAKQLENIKL